MSRAPDTWILTADCPSVLGTVDAVTRYLFEQGCYVKIGRASCRERVS